MNRADKMVERCLNQDLYSVDHCIEFLELYPDIVEDTFSAVEIDVIYKVYTIYNIGYSVGQIDSYSSFFNLIESL